MNEIGIAVCALSVLIVGLSIISDISDGAVAAISALMGGFFGVGVYMIVG